MKILPLLLLALSVSPGANAAPTAPKGDKIVSCSASDGDYVELAIYRNAGGTYRASVTEESFGGSYPTFHYDVKEARAAGGGEAFLGEKFSLTINQERQGKLEIAGVSNEMDCR